MSVTILISNQTKPYKKLQDWCDGLSIKLIRTSFIKTTPITNLEIPTTDWIFFSSPKCATTYISTYPIHAKKIAVYGKGTAETVQEKGYAIDFIGPDTNKPGEIARALEAKASGSILFPISQISKQRIIREIKQLNCSTLVTYKTELASTKISENTPIIIFTSPSNIRGYLLQNELNKSVQLIAFGDTTAQEIEALKLQNTTHVLSAPSESEIIKTLKNII